MERTKRGDRRYLCSFRKVQALGPGAISCKQPTTTIYNLVFWSLGSPISKHFTLCSSRKLVGNLVLTRSIACRASSRSFWTFFTIYLWCGVRERPDRQCLNSIPGYNLRLTSSEQNVTCAQSLYEMYPSTHNDTVSPHQSTVLNL